MKCFHPNPDTSRGVMSCGVMSSWHCDRDQTYPKISEVHTHIDGHTNMPYHHIAYMTHNQRITNTTIQPISTIQNIGTVTQILMTSISTTPTPIFIPPPASPCYWAAAVAEFVAIFHRCHAPPPPPWLKHRHDSTLSSKSNKFAPHIFHDLYFVQCTLLSLFSVNIPKWCAWEKQKTSPGISTSFLLSPNNGHLADPWPILIIDALKDCLLHLRSENAPPIYGMKLRWILLSIRLEMCTLASKLWVPSSSPSTSTWSDMRYSTAGSSLIRVQDAHERMATTKLC